MPSCRRQHGTTADKTAPASAEFFSGAAGFSAEQQYGYTYDASDKKRRRRQRQQSSYQHMRHFSCQQFNGHF